MMDMEWDVIMTFAMTSMLLIACAGVGHKRRHS